jgi:hypothetical protein
MCLQYPQNLVASDSFHLSNTVRITKNNTNLRWCQTFLGKLTDVVVNLKGIKRTLSTCLNNNYKNPIATNWWPRLKAWKLKFNFFIFIVLLLSRNTWTDHSVTRFYFQKKKQLLLCKEWDCKYTNLISISI